LTPHSATTILDSPWSRFLFVLWHCFMHIHPLDLAIVIAYLLGITALGLHFRRDQHTTKDYFLGGRTTPWWAIALSIVATETSTLTIIGVPAIAYSGNLTFLQLVFGYLVGRVLISIVFLPGYFRGDFLTAYALIEKRFGPRMRSIAALTFLVTRTLAEGVRVSAIALVVSAALGTSERLAVFIVIALTVLYTFEGGMKAVIWTDVAQFSLYFIAFLGAGTKSHKSPRPRATNCKSSIFPGISPPSTPSGLESSAAHFSPWPVTALIRLLCSDCWPRGRKRTAAAR
jgi:hypothetical protein